MSVPTGTEADPTSVRSPRRRVGREQDRVEEPDALRRAWSLLLDSSDVIADSITLTLFERDADVYQRIGPELRAEVRASTREHLRRGLLIMSGEDIGSRSASDVWRETGRRRARQGVPLEAVLNAYMLGARVLWEALIDLMATLPAHQRVEAIVLIDAGRAVWSNLDVQNAVLIDAYRRESRRLHRADIERRHALLDGLLEGRGADPEYAAVVRAALGVSEQVQVSCVVVHDGAETLDSLADVEDQLERQGLASHWQLRSGHYFGLVTGDLPVEAELAALIGDHTPGPTGVCTSADGLAGVATAYLLAERAAETIPRGVREAVSVSQRLPEVLLLGNPQVTPLLVAQTLGPLLSQPETQRDTLLETLAALLRHDGSPTHAAEELYCHRNTVIYRLKQIESLTGRSLADPRDKLLLGLGLVADGRA